MYGDLRELKHVLDIPADDLSEDVKLAFLLEHVSEWFEEWLNRPGLTYKTRTEFYKGTGTQNLLLRGRPVNGSQAITVVIDEGGLYGSAPGSFSATPLVYGVDFCLRIDQEDGITSRCGILDRILNYWPKPNVRQVGLLSPFIGEDNGSIKVTYTGGYTVDTLPASIRLAANMAIAKLRYIFPLGSEVTGEGYEERNVSTAINEKGGIFSLVKPLLMPFRNWRW